MKILIICLSYFDDNIYTKFYKTQKNTWDSLEVDGVKTLFLTGNGDDNFIENDVIRTDVKESLFNCGYKTLKAFELIKELDFDFIFRTNSSSYVDKSLLKDYLLEKPKERFYSGVVGNHNGIKFSSGSGFIMTKDLVNLVLENRQSWNHSYIDDVALGLLLKNFGVEPTPAPRYDILTLNENTPLNFYHYRLKCWDRNLDCERMIDLHKLKLKKTEYGKN